MVQACRRLRPSPTESEAARSLTLRGGAGTASRSRSVASHRRRPEPSCRHVAKAAPPTSAGQRRSLYTRIIVSDDESSVAMILVAMNQSPTSAGRRRSRNAAHAGRGSAAVWLLGERAGDSSEGTLVGDSWRGLNQ